MQHASPNPGGRGPLVTGVTLGVVPLAVCEGPAAAPVKVSWGSGPPLAEAWEEPSGAGASLTSLGQELLEEAGREAGERREDVSMVMISQSHRLWKSWAIYINYSH